MTYKTYSADFKREAVKLLAQLKVEFITVRGVEVRSIRELSEVLGIGSNSTIRQWAESGDWGD